MLMLTYIKNVLLEIRPLQWAKNLTIFTFLVFSKELFIWHQFVVVVGAFLSFTALTSSVYIINDLIDLESDRNNPEKRNRPIASGKISKRVAIILACIFGLLALIGAASLSRAFLALCLAYFLLMVCYSLFLKNMVIIDALAIAGGFVIRVLAGAFVIGVTVLYSWVVIVTISIALLLALGKRRSEITLLGENAAIQRKVLGRYPIDLLNSLISALVASTFLSYILLTFQTDINGPNLLQGVFGNGFLRLQNSFLTKQPHLMKFTIPIAFYGIARYLYVIYTKKTGGTPEKVLFTDMPLLATVIIWGFSLIVLLYVS